ncbi:MAG: hypothetical protein V2B20_15785 [Pseudomonadota bacterium]
MMLIEKENGYIFGGDQKINEQMFSPLPRLLNSKRLVLLFLIISVALYGCNNFGLSETPPESFLNMPLHTGLDLFRNQEAKSGAMAFAGIFSAEKVSEAEKNKIVNPMVLDLLNAFNAQQKTWKNVGENEWALYLDFFDKVTGNVTKDILVLEMNEQIGGVVLKRYIEDGVDKNDAIEGLMMGLFW